MLPPFFNRSLLLTFIMFTHYSYQILLVSTQPINLNARRWPIILNSANTEFKHESKRIQDAQFYARET